MGRCGLQVDNVDVFFLPLAIVWLLPILVLDSRGQVARAS